MTLRLLRTVDTRLFLHGGVPMENLETHQSEIIHPSLSPPRILKSSQVRFWIGSILG